MLQRSDMETKLLLLLEFVDSRKDTAFKWGTNDCCLFTADAVIAMGGPDLAAKVRGKYSTEIGAKRVLSKMFKNGLKGALSGILPTVEKDFAQRGDIVLFESELGPTFGIYWIGGIFCAGLHGSVLLEEMHDKILGVWRF